MTAGDKVGADVERCAPRPGGRGGIGRRRARPHAARGSARAAPELFCRAWTRKEAVLKVCGVGIVAELRDLETRPAEAGPVTVEYGTGPGCRAVRPVVTRQAESLPGRCQL
ncbi:4'-phosphopantetheinyl transferase family protein [Streptomyces sp. NPDC001714]|uniref:4'-phosphopantetheinyl transferase family protein n=1 Tax=Streptomyces sp. NPDC001714 TaxID=3364603 RepID=UPI0036AE18B1